MTSAKRVMALSSLGTLILLSIAGVLFARGSSLYGWWLVILGLANVATPLLLTRRQRQMSRAAAERGGDDGQANRGHDQVPTGNARDALARRWLGAAHVPGAMGYV